MGNFPLIIFLPAMGYNRGAILRLCSTSLFVGTRTI